MGKDDADDEWVPPPTAKKKPKNFAMLEGKRKKAKKGKREYRCDMCPKRFVDAKQFSNHKQVHGRLLR